jgi:LacI family transcriptional regulator
MITINDVAKRCGVVKSTVSNALTGKKYVSPELKQRILDVCKELDFQPNFYASTLSRGNTNIVGLVLESDSRKVYRSFYADIIMSCLQTAGAENKNILVYSGLKKEEMDAMLKRDKAPIDGVILVTPLVDDIRIRTMEEQRIPCVIIGRPAQDLEISYVDIDNVGLVSAVVRRIYEKGYRNICLINSEENKTISIDRAKGFCETLESFSDANGKSVFGQESSVEEGRRLSAPYMKQGTAFIASDGNVARGIWDEAREQGLEPARDIYIYSLGEDDPTGVRWEYARQDYRKLGETAMSILLDEIKNETLVRKITTDYFTV